MRAEIKWNGERFRPTWNYSGTAGKWSCYEQAQLQMLESCRDMLEICAANMQAMNSLLQCTNFVRIPHTLKKIQANTAKKKRVKKAVTA